MGGQSVGISSRSSVIAVTVEPPDEQAAVATLWRALRCTAWKRKYDLAAT